jgi:phage tail sheath protein FI
MTEYKYPGVYVEEISFRPKSIDGVSTTTAGFVGICQAGPLNSPRLVTSLKEFEQTFGDGKPLNVPNEAPGVNYLWQSVRAFFAQEGMSLYISRVSSRSADDYGAGIQAFEDVPDISIVAAPGSTANFAGHEDDAVNTMRLLIAHAEQMRYRFAILDCGDHQSVADVRALRGKFDSKYAALYFPWVCVMDPISGNEISLPPSGFVAGIFAYSDVVRSVSKAPANQVVALATRFELSITDAQQEVLNPEGINCFRTLPGRGNVLWGARTVSSDPEWKYVNVRRYLSYVEQSIDRGTQWAVFEHNDETLWRSIQRGIEDFLYREWTSGSLTGDKPEKAYFVRCDRATMTQNDLDNGRLVCLIGVAPTKPAEFVTFSIGQWTADHRQ